MLFPFPRRCRSQDPVEMLVAPAPSVTAGFTLTELLIAALLTGLLATATIGSLTQMMQLNQRAAAQMTRRQELDRALGFIGDEVHHAAAIIPDATADLSTIAPNFNPSRKTPILVLTLPDADEPVIYYLRDKTATWFGPKVLYRWGPPLKANGLYSNESPNHTLQHPNLWPYEAVVDVMDDKRPIPNPPCPPGWMSNPPESERQGAYTCVDSQGTLAEIVLRGQILEASGISQEIHTLSSQFSPRSQR